MTAKGSSKDPRKTAVLNVGLDQEWLLRRQHILGDAGFDVYNASSFDEARQVSRGREFRVVIFGHLIPVAERLRIFEVMKKANPRVRQVVMYDHSATKTESADAILRINVRAGDLVHTVEYLLAMPQNA